MNVEASVVKESLDEESETRGLYAFAIGHQHYWLCITTILLLHVSISSIRTRTVSSGWCRWLFVDLFAFFYGVISAYQYLLEIRDQRLRHEIVPYRGRH